MEVVVVVFVVAAAAVVVVVVEMLVAESMTHLDCYYLSVFSMIKSSFQLLRIMNRSEKYLEEKSSSDYFRSNLTKENACVLTFSFSCNIDVICNVFFFFVFFTGASVCQSNFQRIKNMFQIGFFGFSRKISTVDSDFPFFDFLRCRLKSARKFSWNFHRKMFIDILLKERKRR